MCHHRGYTYLHELDRLRERERLAERETDAADEPAERVAVDSEEDESPETPDPLAPPADD